MKTSTASPTLNPILLSTAILSIACLIACSGSDAPPAAPTDTPEASAVAAGAIAPILITEPTAVDTDDPAIWINPDDPAGSLILGTDKGGSIYVFDLDGKIIPEKTVAGMGRMNNIDVAYGFSLDGETIDIAARHRPQ